MINFEDEFTQDGSQDLAADTSFDAGRSVDEAVVPAQDRVVTLPPGVELENLEVDGRDLIIIMSDGSRVVVADGAVFVPQIVVNGVAVPPLNIAQLLTGNEPEPAAGQTQSSGGNFAGDEGEIQAAYDIGDLLPFTDFSFPEEREEEVFPTLGDEEPEVVIQTPDNPAGVANATATVGEEGLPAREGEPAGTNEEGDAETATGTIVFNSPDGPSDILINGVEITGPGQTIPGPFGTLTIVSFDPVTGEIGFEYTLADNTTNPGDADIFNVTVIDADGDQASATLTINIQDDGPIAADDNNTVPAGSFDPVTGDVLVNDVPGADGYAPDGAVSAVSNGEGSAEPGQPLQGEFGVLTLNPDGTYTYTRDPNTPGGVTDTFTYTIVDSDGSTSTATLTIEIGDSPAAITFVPGVGEGTEVNEAGLPPRGDEPVGSGEGADANPDNNSDPSESTGSTITFESPDGLGEITIGGTTVEVTDVPQEVEVDGGTLIITEVTFDPETGEGTITYEFTLEDNTDGDDTTFDFDIVITDLDGDSVEDTLTITVVDDVPTAVDDSATQTEENAPVTVDAFANDTEGADGVSLDDIAIVDDTLSGEGELVYNGDGTFTYTPAPGEEGTVTFDYTITDSDGDTSTATVTIDLLDDSTPSLALEGGSTVDEAGLDARGDEPAGSDAASDTETTSGVIGVNTGNDTVASLVINGVDVTDGGTVATDKGVLTVTLVDGVYNYTYELTDNTLTDPDSDTFTITVTDSDGDTASTDLIINIVDDIPAAEDDANSLDAGEFGPATGNVLDNDTEGADGADVSAISGFGGSGAPGEPIQGEYGVLTINPDGTYTYTRDPGTPGGVTDTFTYTITDGDGDTAEADLVITIADAPVTLDVPLSGSDGTQVLESGLAGPPEGSNAAFDFETTAGSFTFAAPDGPATVTIDGVEVTSVGQTFTGAFGTLTITAIADGVISYSYELTTNTDGDDTADEFAIVVTDQDGDEATGTLEIDIIDDMPEAVADFDEVIENEGGLADGNVLTGTGGTDANDLDGVADTQGADGAVVQTTGIFNGTYGTLTLLADGTYEYVLTQEGEAALELLTEGESLEDVFPYTIIDGDGDTSETTLTITLRGADDPVTLNGVVLGTPLVIVDEANLPDGTSPDNLQLTQLGNFSFDAPDGLDDVTIGGVTVVQDGTLVPGQTIDTPAGLITVTGFVPTTSLDGTVTGGTILFEYLLQDNTLLHDEPSTDLSSEFLDVVVTDEDGDSDSGVLQIDIVDDVPTAVNDSATQTAENAPVTVDAFANDTPGADGVALDAVAIVDGTLSGTGSVVYNGDGTFTYTPGPGEQGDVTFDYTITDSDGDTSIATVTITLLDDSNPMGGETVATVDDDGLADGNALSTTGDIDANVDDDPADTSEASFTGTLDFDVGNDTPATITFAPTLDGSTATVGQETVTYSVSGSILTATITGGDRDGTDLFTVEITDPATGEYTVTLLENVIHDAGDDENNAFASLDFTVADSEGETALTNLGLVFNDDGPTAADDTATQAAENAAFTIDALANDAFGADGVDITDATSVTVSTQATQGTVTYDPVTGLFTYTPAPGAGSNDSLTDTFEYTIVDADGDTSTASVTVTLQPDSEPTADVTIAAVDDDGLADGNPLSGSPSGLGAVFNGTLTFDVGNDGPATIGFAAAADGLTATVGQETVTYSVVGNVLTATISASPDAGRIGTDLFTVEIADPATGEYEVTLLTNVLHLPGGGEDFTLPFDTAVPLSVTDNDGDVLEGDGSPGTPTLFIDFADDSPTATENLNSVTEGSSVSGNILTDDDGEGTDVAGADGFAATGAIQTVVSDNTANGPTVDGAGNLVVIGEFGTLTLNPVTGSYTYVSNPNSTNVDAVETFTYTVVDADGDTDSAVLTIDIANVAGTVEDNNATVSEAGLDGIGSDGASDSEIFATGVITVTDAIGPFTFTLDDPAVGNFGTLTLNPDGTYSYELTTPVDGDSLSPSQGGNNGANTVTGQESFNYTVTDSAGNIIGTGTIDVDIVDDVPTATDQTLISVAEDAVGTISGNVVTDGTPDTEGADGATVTAITIDGNTTAVPQDGTSVTVTTANGTYTIDQTGAWTFDPNPNLDQTSGPIDAGFTYTLTDSDGDFDTAEQPIEITDGAGPAAGPDISLSLDDATLPDGSAPGSTSASDTITFTPGSDDIDSIVFGTDLTGLDPALQWVRSPDGTQITGSDNGRPVVTLDLTVTNNVATVTANLIDNFDDHPIANDADVFDLGDVDVVATDIDGDTASATVSVAVEDDLPTITAGTPAADALTVDETDLATNATADFSTLFTSDVNADGPGTPISYALGINTGTTGLVDTETGQPVVLTLESGIVYGRNSDGDAVFTVTVDNDPNSPTYGSVTLDQLRAVVHDDPGSDNEPATLNAADLITLSATIVDSDGDTASATANIAGALTFLDDGPALSNVALASSVSVDETGGLDSATSAASILSFVADFGEDGDNGTAFTLGIVNTNSGLATAVGDYPITLVQTNPTTITGQFNDGTGVQDAFTVVINADGTVTLTQLVALEHETDGPTGPTHDDTLDLDGLINATVTITDGDNDTDSATLEIGAALTFFDDGPSVELSATPNDLTVSDAEFGDDDEDFSDAFIFEGGEDGTASIEYALSTTDGAPSGLFDALTDEPILLREFNGSIEGYTATSNQVVFVVSVDAAGEVTLDLGRAIDHALSNGDGDTTSTLIADDLIQLTATITDNDGDTAEATLDIGQNLNFTDDVPTAADTEEVLLDEDVFGGNPGGPDDQDPDAVSTIGTLVDPTEGFGNDGGTVAFATTGAPAGFTYVASGSDILIQQDQNGTMVTVVTVTLDPNTGDYSVALNANILHEDDAANEENEQSFTLSATLTDGDGDTATTSLTITVDDDTPVANNDGEIASVDDNVVAENVGTVADLTGNDNFGADGEGATPITIATGSLGGTITIDGSGNLLYTSATNVTAPFADVIETFTYTITDGDGDTQTATFSIRITDEGPAIDADAATFTVDEEGLGGIAGNGDSSGDAPGEVTVQSGTLSGIDFGTDGPGSITLTAVADTGLVTLDGNAVETVWDPLTNTLTGQDSSTGDDVFTLVITDVATGAYTFTLLAPIAHPDGTSEDDQTLSVGVIVADAEGETASGTITVVIDDDSPVATDDTNALGEDTDTVSGDVLTDGTPDEFGADGAGDPAVVAATGVGGVAGVVGGPTSGAYGTLTLNDDGSYTYDLDNANPLVQGLDDGETLTETFTYTIEDADGDKSEATLTITINGANDAPVAIADTNFAIEDATAPTEGNVLQSITHPGAPSGTFADVADTDVDGDTLSVTTVGTFVGTYGTLTLNADGSYSYVLDNNNAAVQALNEGDTPLTDTFNYTATDGDLDSSSTLTISIFGTNDAPVVGTAIVATSDEGLAGGLADTAGNPTDTTDSNVATGTISITDVDSSTFTVTLNTPSDALTSGGEAITWSLSADGKTLTGSTTSAGAVLTVVIDDAGAFTVTQLAQIDHADTTSEDVTGFTVDVSVSDGTDTTTQIDAITVNFEDDSPEITSPIADAQVLNDPGQPSLVGDLNFAAGGDGPGTTTMIMADVSAITVGGQPIITSQTGNVLTGFVDSDGSGDLSAGDLEVFTLAVDPAAGTSGEYTFDLLVPVDGETTQVILGQGTAFGVGPSDSVLVSQAGVGELTFVTGWNPAAGNGLLTNAELADFLAGGTPTLNQDPSVNGSTQGFGLGSNNFDAGQFIRFDFGALDDYDGAGPFTPPGGTNVLNASFATFDLKNFSSTGSGNDVVHFVARFTDGTSETITLDAAAGDPSNITINAPPGALLSYIDVYSAEGSVKLNLIDVGVTETTVDVDIPVSVKLTDSDGDSAMDDFVINIFDDAPDAQDDLNDAVLVTEDINAAFVLDFSGSVDDAELNLQLNAVKDAAFELFESTTGNLDITLISFSTTAQTEGTFSDFASFAAAIDALNEELGGDRPFNGATNFTDAIEQLIADFEPDPNANNQIFFLSDGNPNREVQTTTSGSTTPGGGDTIVNSLSTTVQPLWDAFVNNNDINVTAIGIGNSVNNDRLQDVDVDGEGAPVLADDFGDLLDTLISVVTPEISGSVLDNDIPATNGIEVVAITVDGINYAFDGVNTITPSVGAPISGTSFMATTAFGGELTFDFTDGSYTYIPPETSVPEIENFQYTVSDADGDIDTAVLRIDIEAVAENTNFALNDVVITNSGSTVTIDEAFLLANDEAGTTITSVGNGFDGSVAQSGNTVIFTDTGDAGGSFTYSAANGGDANNAFVTVNRDQAGQTQLDGTSGDDILIGRDGANDVLVGNEGADVLFGGTGADLFAFFDGDSTVTVGGSGDNGTISGFDTIVDFTVGVDEIDFVDTGFGDNRVVPPNGTTNGIDSTLTIGGQTIKSHSISDGIITFSTSNTFSGAVTLTSESDVAAVVNYLQSQSGTTDIGNNGVVAFVVGNDTYIFNQDQNDPIQSVDSLVKLEGVQLTNLTTLVNAGDVRPIVLDLDGDGAEFVGVSAGVSYDYDGDGTLEATAWAGADDAILAYDADGNGLVSDASEFVFGNAQLTDLEAVAQRFDDNGDGVLDASDAAYSQFGIWQDANLNGVNDDGEFTSLADAGIIAINLVSDGEVGTAAGGDVTIFGKSTFVFGDGRTGELADAAFSTERNSRTLEQAAAAAAGFAAFAVADHSTSFVPIESVELETTPIFEVASLDYAMPEPALDSVFDLSSFLVNAAEFGAEQIAANSNPADDIDGSASSLAFAAGFELRDIEPLLEQAANDDAFAGSHGAGGFGDVNVAQSMEALLIMDMVATETIDGTEIEMGAAVDAILADIAATSQLDQVIDNLSQVPDLADKPIFKFAGLDSDLLNQTFDMGINPATPLETMDGQLEQAAAASAQG